jgi:hypothetical protein
MSASATWRFTTGTNLQVAGLTPADTATRISPAAVVRATFLRAVDGSTVDGSRFTLMSSSGQSIPAIVTFDESTNSASLTPNAPLDPLTTYTATLNDSVRAADGAPLDGRSWGFTTALTPPPAPAITGLFPTDGSTGVSNLATVRASFDTALDPATVTSQTVQLTPKAAAPSRRRSPMTPTRAEPILTPSAPLAIGTHYIVTITTGVRSTTGAPLTSGPHLGLRHGALPVLPVRLTGAGQHGPSDAGRALGRWTVVARAGVRVKVTAPSQIVALRFYKNAQETGTHVVRVWDAAGQELARVTFQNESASGWQRQALASPLSLQVGATYTISAGLNAFFVNAVGGLSQQIASGPLQSVADTANGVYSDAAGTFPAQSWRSTNYFIDV